MRLVNLRLSVAICFYSSSAQRQPTNLVSRATYLTYLWRLSLSSFRFVQEASYLVLAVIAKLVQHVSGQHLVSYPSKPDRLTQIDGDAFVLEKALELAPYFSVRRHRAAVSIDVRLNEPVDDRSTLLKLLVLIKELAEVLLPVDSCDFRVKLRLSKDVSFGAFPPVSLGLLQLFESLLHPSQRLLSVG